MKKGAITMKKMLIVLIAVVVTAVLVISVVEAKVIRSAIWADGELFGVTITPKDVPARGPFDKLYNFDESGLMGQRSISETKPGDRDYNGGRWEVIPVTFTEQGIAVHDPDGDDEVNFELVSDGQLMEHEALGHLTIGAPVRYFVCPLHPEKD
jgi:hypothetical protein